MRRVLIVPDKFKGSLTAGDVARHLGAGIRRTDPSIAVDQVLVADGGEGTVAAALAAGFGEVKTVATGPLGHPVPTRYALNGDAAVIEMAAVSGFEMITPSSETARRSTSRGVGELLVDAMNRGTTDVTIGLGGSASTDGGAGMLAALGARLLRRDGSTLPDGGESLRDIAISDFSGLDPRLETLRLVAASDVDNPLLGPLGAAAVYGPQKGLRGPDILAVEEGLTVWRDLVDGADLPAGSGHAHRPGAGAAGGVGFALLAIGAAQRPGVEVVLDLVGFYARAHGADLVITGEGRLDEQTLHGKTPVGVAAAAKTLNVPTVAVCGQRSLTNAQAKEAGLAGVYALAEFEPDLERCLTEPRPILERIAGLIVQQHLKP